MRVCAGGVRTWLDRAARHVAGTRRASVAAGGAQRRRGNPLPLQWGKYRPGTLVAAEFGLREPPPPWLPAETIGEADVILVPALAVDRSGARLGRGAGFYDRTLHHAAATAQVIAVVRDDELLDEIPAEPHDVAMTHVLTPKRGIVALR